MSMHVFAQNAHSLYRFARVSAGLKSRELAADKLCCSARHLASIELGERTPRPEDVVEMVKLYGNKQVAKVYCKTQCPLCVVLRN